jgi:adenosylcobinamide kinase / adenosylcobinamide-phosphate guanylyltransferase
MTVSLILGGARSGKSALALREAEDQAAARGVRPTMIVTAQAFDDEMHARIQAHQAEREGRWSTVEAPHALSRVIAALGADDVAVVDCLTLWLSNRLLAEADLEAEQAALLAAVAAARCPLWLVSNEVGMGIVPESALGRRFRDAAGRLHQALAAQAARVVFVAAGLPLTLKG